MRIQNKIKLGGVYAESEWRDIVSATTVYRCDFAQINSVENIVANANSAISYAKIVLRPVDGLKATSRIVLDGMEWDVVGEPKQKELRMIEIMVKRTGAG